jgi:arylsulfatase A-like enzyme
LYFESRYDSQSRIETLKARYDESIAYVDHYVGQFISAVHQDLGPNTAIFLTSDHGESFDHGYGSHGGVMLWEDLIHVPFIMSLPGAAAGRREDLASQVDLAPTIAAVAGLPPPADWVGRSLVSATEVGNPTVFSMNFEENRSHMPLATGAIAALRSHWKLLRFFGDPRYPHVPLLKNQLFDLRTDPHEHADLESAQPGIAAELSSAIDEQLARHGGAVGG